MHLTNQLTLAACTLALASAVASSKCYVVISPGQFKMVPTTRSPRPGPGREAEFYLGCHLTDDTKTEIKDFRAGLGARFGTTECYICGVGPENYYESPQFRAAVWGTYRGLYQQSDCVKCT